MMLKTTFVKSLFLIALISNTALYAQNKILFNATKAEMCSNADWVIDADAHNIYFSSTTHLPYASTGSSGQSNPQRFPSPAQSGITAATTETYWDGAISAWAVDCAKQGYSVETLPFNVPITYGSTTNVQDLSNYKVFVVDEPNILFSAAEKTAIMNFVSNGGGLMMIGDHTGSDRNFDTYDSPMIWNDLMANNSVLANAFGITFDLVDTNNITTSNFPNLPTNSILHGTFGNVTQVKFYSGTTLTLNAANNSSVQGLVYKTGASTTGSVNAMVASALYSNGKVVAIGDSSIPDDGTGDPNDTNLFDGYTTDAGGNHRKLLMNAIIWLMTPNLSISDTTFDATHFTIAPNPIDNKELHLSFSSHANENAKIIINDNLGRTIKEVQTTNIIDGLNRQAVDLSEIQSGIYTCSLITLSGSKSLHFVVK